MSIKYRVVILLSTGLLALPALFALIASPATAGPEAGLTAFLPFLTSPVSPTEEYKADFSDSIAPWRAVRWQKTATFNVDHEDGCDSSHCGFLEMRVDQPDQYAIVSPLVLGPQRPYEIEFRAKLKEREDKHQYGVVFGADWQAGACPGDNTSTCFNHYYEFRVRFRDVNSDRFLEYRLRRVDGHDANNIEQGEDLLDWTRAEGVNADDWVKWSVRYGTRHITFKANNNELPGSVETTRFGDPAYFGLLARAGDNGDVHVRFDEFGIAHDQ